MDRIISEPQNYYEFDRMRIALHTGMEIHKKAVGTVLLIEVEPLT